MNRRLALVAFTASGAAGLIFEVAAQRQLARIFGVSAYATSTVLATYMAGLAIGAWLWGRRADRVQNPLRLYAVLEFGIAIGAITLPWLTALGFKVFVSAATGAEPGPPLLLGRFALAAVLLAAPTILMGGTLPAFARALARGAGTSEKEVAAVYTANVFGAAFGAAVAAYALLPALGLRGTLLFGATLNTLAAFVALALAKKWQPSTEAGPAAEPTQIAPRALRLWSLWSGFFTFAIEVTWVHLLAVVIGNSAYAFGLMLAIFLIGLTLGSGWVSRQPAEQITRGRLGLVQLAAAVTLMLTFPLWDRTPSLFIIAGRVIESFAGRELFRALICVELLLLPAAILGAVYPMLLRMAARQSEAGAAVGGLAAANTLGAVLGSLVTGFVLLPALHSEGMLRVLVTLAVAAAGLAAFKTEQKKVVFAAPVVLLVIWLLPSWNLARLAAGSNVYFDDRGYGDGEVTWAKESVEGGLTSVIKQKSGASVMLTNGKFQGSDMAEMEAQLGFAQLPMLLDHGFDRAVVIGLGTGVTLASMADQPFTEVEGVELSRDVVEAARDRFGHVNKGVLAGNPKVKLFFDDGRNHLLLSEKKYDVISLELSSIWFAGAADLYNREFYELVRDRLAPHGVLQQWVQLHHLTRFDLAVILESVRAVIPHVVLFERGGQGIILASMEPFRIDYPHLVKLSEQLKGTMATHALPGDELMAMLADQVLDSEGIIKLVAQEKAFVSTDDNLHLEYSTPRGNSRKDLAPGTLLKSLEGLTTKALTISGAETEAQQQHVRAAYLAGLKEWGPALEAARKAKEGGAPVDRLLTHLETKIGVNP